MKNRKKGQGEGERGNIWGHIRDKVVSRFTVSDFPTSIKADNLIDTRLSAKSRANLKINAMLDKVVSSSSSSMDERVIDGGSPG